MALVFGLVALILPMMIKARNKRADKLQIPEGPTGGLAKPPTSGLTGEKRLTRESKFEPDTSAPAAKQEAWSALVLQGIEWRRFEAVCEALFEQAGFTTKSQSHGPDGGVDIWLFSRHAEGAVAIVQCKHWLTRPVGVKEVREFLGTMASNQLKRGTFATSSTFTHDALEFAKKNGINSVDGVGLLTLIAKRTQEQQSHLLATAYDGEYWRPTCPSCGIKLLERGKARKFWGCANFPQCKTQIWQAKGA
ncbi:MAG: restriction endonuclease [Pseudomonadota bacterium]